MTTRTVQRLVALFAASATAVTVALTAAPAHAVGVGERCTVFEGATRCARIMTAGSVFFGGSVYVHDGGGAGITMARMQRKTQNGWVTVRRDGPTATGGTQADNYAKGPRCRNLDGGTYRARTTVTWTNGGVHYTRTINSKARTKQQIC
jgi:hypothetical protein